MNTKREYRSFDYWLVILVCAVAVFGIIVLGSATHINLLPEIPGEYSNQKLWFVIGLVLMIPAAFIDYHFIAKFYVPIYVLNLLLLGVVLLVSAEAENVTRYISIGPISILPSEFAKIFMIICLAKFIDNQQEKLNNILMLVFILLSVILPVIMIIKQPSLSAGLVTMVISIAMVFVAGIDYRYVLGVLAVVIPPSVLLYIDLRSPQHLMVDQVLEVLSKYLGEYQMSRITDWLYPGNVSWYYQTNQSIHAIGSGLLYGKGLYKGTINQSYYLPASNNDFIFAVIGEEFGFVGCVAVLALFFLIIMKCLLIAYNSVDLLGRLIAFGVAVMLAFQVFVNVGVAMGLLPNTGMALPFISSGGSSMLISMMCIGLVLNVGMTKSKSFFEG